MSNNSYDYKAVDIKDSMYCVKERREAYNDIIYFGLHFLNKDTVSKYADDVRYDHNDYSLDIYSSMEDKVTVTYPNGLMLPVRQINDKHNTICSQLRKDGSNLIALRGVYIVESFNAYRNTRFRHHKDIGHVLHHIEIENIETNQIDHLRNIEELKDFLNDIPSTDGRSITSFKPNKHSYKLRYIYYIPRTKFEQGNKLYISKLNLGLVLGNVSKDSVHPLTSEHRSQDALRKLVELNIHNTFDYRIVDNTNKENPPLYYISIGKSVKVLESIYSPREESGAYVKQHKINHSVMNETFFPLSRITDAEIYKTFEEAESSGDKNILVELKTLENAKRKVEIDAEKIELESVNNKLKAKSAMLSTLLEMSKKDSELRTRKYRNEIERKKLALEMATLRVSKRKLDSEDKILKMKMGNNIISTITFCLQLLNKK